MFATYVDLKKAFDSVHGEALWDLLHLRGIPAGIIGLLSGLYSGTESAVKCGRGVFSFFPVHTEVRWGCVLAPSFFNTCMDGVLGRVVLWESERIEVYGEEGKICIMANHLEGIQGTGDRID